MLQCAGRGARYVPSHSQPVQRLYLHPQGQYVPVAAHHCAGQGGHPLRDPDPHLGYALHRRIRCCGTLEVQGRPFGQGQAWRRSWPGCASFWKPSRRATMWKTSCAPSKPISPRRKCLCSPPRAMSSTCRSGLHHHRLCLCHSLGGGQPDDGRQGGRAHHAHRHGGENRHDHRDHHRQHGQGPQPRLAQGRQDQRGTQQDPRLVQKGEAGGEHRRRPGGTGTGVPAQLYQPDRTAGGGSSSAIWRKSSR